MAEEVVVTDDTFEQVIGDGLVLVDFYADWCMPCRMLAPTLEQLGDEYSDRLTIARLDVDQSSNTAVRFRVSGIPTLILFKDGEAKDQIVGAVPKTELQKAINESL